MSPVSQQLLDATNLSEDAWFADSPSRFLDLQSRLNDILAASPAPETEVLVVNGPRTIDVERRQDLPVVVLRYATGARNWEISTALNQYLVVQDLEKGAVRVQLLAERGEERSPRPAPSGSGVPPDANTARATSTALRRLFLRELLKLEWQPARLALTLLSQDALSNTHAVTLTRGERSAADATLPTVPPSEFVTCPTPAAATPAGAAGLSWSLMPDSTTPRMLQGQINTTADQVALARSSPAGQQADILRASLLVVSIDRPPRAVPLAIPAVVQGAPGRMQTVSASFCIEVAGAIGPPDQASARLLYLFAGLQTAGPLRIPPAGKAASPSR